MTLKKYRLIIIGAFIIITPLMGLAAVMGYGWISVPVWVAWGILVGLLRLRVKELILDERAFSITEKSFSMACIIFMFLAGIGGSTLLTLTLGRGKPVMLSIGWTLLGSSTALALFFYLAKIYLSRKMGGKA
jgi:uncharacterized membrane protein